MGTGSPTGTCKTFYTHGIQLRLREVLSSPCSRKGAWGSRVWPVLDIQAPWLLSASLLSLHEAARNGPCKHCQPKGKAQSPESWLISKVHVNEWRGTCLMVQWLRNLLLVDASSIPGLGRSHTTQAYVHSYWAHILEPSSHNYEAWAPQNLCSATREATSMRSPCTATREQPRPSTSRESPCTVTKTQHSQK